MTDLTITNEIQTLQQELIEKGWPRVLIDRTSTFRVHEWDRRGYRPQEIIFCAVCKNIGPSVRQEIEGECYYECQNCHLLNEHFFLENSQGQLEI